MEKLKKRGLKTTTSFFPSENNPPNLNMQSNSIELKKPRTSRDKSFDQTVIDLRSKMIDQNALINDFLKTKTDLETVH